MINMEIYVNSNDELNAALCILHKNGYTKSSWNGISSDAPIVIISTYSNGTYECYNNMLCINKKPISLNELKLMFKD